MRSAQKPFPLILPVVALLLFAPLAIATTYYVDNDCTVGIELGTDPNFPFCTISRAMLAIEPNDVVKVAPGSYNENIFVPFGITLMGQCTPVGSDPYGSCDPDNPCVENGPPTNLCPDPNTSTSGLTDIVGTGRGSVVSVFTGNATVFLDGFTIRGGNSLVGGGVAISGSPTICNNIIMNNTAVGTTTAVGVGGGIYVEGNPTIMGNLICGNTVVSGQGGGIAIVAGSPTITRNNIIGNSALTAKDGFFGYGGGIAILDSALRPLITSNVIQGNRADQGGGAINIYHSEPAIAGNTIVDNDAGLPGRAVGHGGGIEIVGDTNSDVKIEPLIINNIIWNNTAQVAGGGIDVLRARPFFRNNNLFDNLPDNFHGKAAPAASDGNLSMDPNLDANLEPGASFPHVDAGSNGLVLLDPDLSTDPNVIGDKRVTVGADLGDLDLAALPRRLDGNRDGSALPDIGAFETSAVQPPDLMDLDDDGVPADGGTSMPNPCMPGETVGCDDNCPALYNPFQEDGDGDGVGDNCDNCAKPNGDCGDPNMPTLAACDIDDDGAVDPNEFDMGFQLDSDKDLIGDPCDADLDNDGVLENFPGAAFCVGKQKVSCSDNCPAATNETQADKDHDAIGDLCDNCFTKPNGDCAVNIKYCDVNRSGKTTSDEIVLGEQADKDVDGVGDACDNCPTVPNGNCNLTSFCDVDGDEEVSSTESAQGFQNDSDGDKIGDACELDTDNDKVYCRLVSLDPNNPFRQSVSCDAPCTNGAITGCDDNCPAQKNATQEDADGDGVGDTCDNCDVPNGDCGDPNMPTVASCDMNNDNMVDPNEFAMGFQLDTDRDGMGNPCDTDDDNDTALEDGGSDPCPGPDPNLPAIGCDDNCPTVSNSGQGNLDGDEFGDLCDDDSDGDMILADDLDGVVDRCRGGNTAGCDDNCPSISNPSQEDDDQDSIGDVCDNCPNIANIFQENQDRFVVPDPNIPDGLGDVCDPDRDGDSLSSDPNSPIPPCSPGVYDPNSPPACADNCPTIYNLSQADSDGDGVGDPCDNCAARNNPAQTDCDLDEIGDACDICPGLINLGFNASDADGDTIKDSKDNCLCDPNPLQTDSDKDGTGDACERDDDLVCDDDGDGFPDGDPGDNPTLMCGMSDNCPTICNNTQVDTDSDGIGDACDLCPATPTPINTDGDNDGRGDPCDPAVMRVISITGPGTARVGVAATYVVTLANRDAWEWQASYTISGIDKAGIATTLDLEMAAAVPFNAGETMTLNIGVTFPTPGTWLVNAAITPDPAPPAPSTPSTLTKSVNVR